MKKYLVLIFLAFLFSSTSAQNPKLDSISNLLNATKGKERIPLLTQLGSLIYAIDPIKTYQIGEELLVLAKKYSNTKAIGEGKRLIGVSFHVRGELDKALSAYLEALQAYETANHPIGVATIANNLGGLYFSQRNWEQALKYYQESLSKFDELGLEQHTGKPLNNIGAIHERMGNFEQALEFYKTSLEIKRKYKQERGTAYTLNNIGVILMNQKQFKEAQEYYQQALEVMKAWGDKAGLAEIYSNLGLINYHLRKYTEASQLYQKSLEIALEQHDLQAVQGNYLRMCELDSSRENYIEALKWMRLHVSYKDSLLNSEKNKQLIDIREKYESEKKETENILLKKEKKQQRIILWAALIVVLLFIAIGIGLIRVINLKKRTNLLLRGQKRQIEQKNRELEQKNEEILTQAENLRDANLEIQKINHQMTDSINYAKRIQSALLSQEELLKNNFSEHFILFKPRDIVSGDFFWMKKVRQYFLLAVVDCTGHGVPGGFMSMLGIAFLNEIVQRREITTANQVLDEMRKQVKMALKQTGKFNEPKDGMDMALCVINTETRQLQFSGANNPLIIISDGELKSIKGDKNPIGVYYKEQPFSVHTFDLKKGDQLFLFSDGYADQFGGGNDMKYTVRRFREKLIEINGLPKEIQKEHLENEHENWKGVGQQIDDILVASVKV